MVVDNTDDLRQFCNDVLSSNTRFIAIDTEFISSAKYKYFPKLCLIQIGYEGNAAVIDVLAPNIDLSILKELLFNPGIVKVFHDFQQDILALLTVFDYIPQPLMDTQMMAMFCRCYSSSIGYSELVSSVLGVKLSKESKRTDWIVRPLSDQQIQYALSDVTYLCLVYKKLYAQLKLLNRMEWVQEDIAGMTNRLAIPYTSKNEGNIVIRQLLSEYRIQNKLVDNVSDAQIYRVSCAKHYSKGLLTQVVLNKYVDELYSKLLVLQQHLGISNGDKPKVYLIQAIIQQFCLNNDISYQVMSSSSEIVRLISDDLCNVRLASGWRYKQIGSDLIAFLQGKRRLNMFVENKHSPLVVLGLDSHST